MKLDYNVLGFCVAAITKILPQYVRDEVLKQMLPGPRGFKGSDGIEGVIGPQGVKGERGHQGDAGSNGKAGVDGAIGKGVIGSRGLRGRTGEVGSQGKHGERGINGVNGIDGVTGPQGESGPQGDVGPSPHHQWMGFKLRFQNPDGTWGKYTNLKGPTGDRGDGSGALFDGFAHGNLIITENNYLSTGNERIICTAPLTVMLNPSPFNDETVFVKRTNGEVTINGNGHDIDADSTAILSREYTTLRLSYAGDLQKWMIT